MLRNMAIALFFVWLVAENSFARPNFHTSSEQEIHDVSSHNMPLNVTQKSIKCATSAACSTPAEVGADKKTFSVCFNNKMKRSTIGSIFLDFDGTIEKHDELAHVMVNMLEGKKVSGEFGGLPAGSPTNPQPKDWGKASIKLCNLMKAANSFSLFFPHIEDLKKFGTMTDGIPKYILSSSWNKVPAKVWAKWLQCVFAAIGTPFPIEGIIGLADPDWGGPGGTPAPKGAVAANFVPPDTEGVMPVTGNYAGIYADKDRDKGNWAGGAMYWLPIKKTKKTVPDGQRAHVDNSPKYVQSAYQAGIVGIPAAPITPCTAVAILAFHEKTRYPECACPPPKK